LVRVTQILTVPVLGKVMTLFNASIVGIERENGQKDINRVFGPFRIAVWGNSDRFSFLSQWYLTDSACREQYGNMHVACGWLSSGSLKWPFVSWRRSTRMWYVESHFVTFFARYKFD
jgi:hypothetical protein